MKIYLVRHGETELNKKHLMQGRTDIRLNENGIYQARALCESLKGISFTKVYSSPLIRARQTASLVSGLPDSGLHIDERLIETDFGKYEGKNYLFLGLRMHLYWLCPEIFPAPETVETISSMTERARAFFEDMFEDSDPCDNILIVSHGGILRALNGYLLNRPNGIKWRPKMHNCEVRIYDIPTSTGKGSLSSISFCKSIPG